MLTPAEQVAFLVLVLACGALAARGFGRIVRVVRRGRPAERSDGLLRRFVKALIDVGLQKPIFKTRPWVSLFHGFVFFGFSFYLLVNVNDVLEAYVEGWTTIGGGPVAGVFNLFSDLFSVLVLTGMALLLYRRFVQKPKALEFNPSVLLDARVRAGGVRSDSLIVGVFILLHVGSRWVGTALHLARDGHGDPWLPTASLLAPLFDGLGPAQLDFGIHLCWWLAMGLIVLFLPYFPRSKHLHLMVAPVNLALAKETPRGLLEAPADPAEPGAKTLTDLAWPQLLDSYACIMCNRCQDACPAHESGTPLSPAALEINKRYFLNDRGAEVAAGGGNGASPRLLDFATSVEAVWSCTTCYACVEICPVGNAPMFDLIEMRRALVFDGETPDDVAEVLRSLDEKGNSFGQSARRRARWTKGLEFKIPDARKQAVEFLWYVGDFASYDPQCQEVSRNVARILHAAGVDFGILYEGERSTGNDIRRIGEEGLFDSLAEQNHERFAECEFERIVTTDPHTFNALKNEYGDHGHPVLHYSALLLELIQTGRIALPNKRDGRSATYHDPCYLGRYNGGFDAPRNVITACGVELAEMPRNRENSFCCGAGGGRIWMQDHEGVKERPSENRIREALELGEIDYFVVSCPKDLTMYRDAVKTSGNEGRIEVWDISDFVVDAMAPASQAPVSEAPQG
jgi:Fe-S oxidoreductase